MKAAKTSAEAWAEEEKLKELVYGKLEADLHSIQRDVQNQETYVRSGAYEEQDAFTAYGGLSAAKRREQAKRQEFLSVSKKPYYTHMQIRPNGGEVMQVMLSDCPELQTLVWVDNNICILPFLNNAAPMVAELIRQHSNKQPGSFVVKIDGRVTTYQNEMLRDVDISYRKLCDVTQYFPTLQDAASIDADELLAQRLDENRADARMQNIIATLQSSQDQIIRSPLNESFVVQGCAGSGKTQCLLHRLFFLRGELGDRGWSKVLLITPTQLFRNYSRELMKRYQLTDVANLSLANLYQELLSAFDARFKARQYAFELTEEFLSDTYLQNVYDAQQILHIETEIARAIRAHVQQGRDLLGITEPLTTVHANLVTELAEKLDAAIKDFDARAERFSQNAEYKEHMDALDREEKQIASLFRRLDTLEQAEKELEQRQAEYDRLKHEVDLIETQQKLWREQREQERELLRKRHMDALHSIGNSGGTLSDWDAYRRSLYPVMDAESPFGRTYQKNREEEVTFEELRAMARQNLSDFMGGQSERAWLHKLSDRRSNLAQQRKTAEDKLNELAESTDGHNAWIRAYTQENDSIQSQRRGYRANLERAHYYLSRIESSVFEQEVWNALAPLKERCGIKTLIVEEAADGHKKQTRILYKSDLLFYLKIYLHLHSAASLPPYDMICIDEGQDLHSADYALLKEMFPAATFNVFGDTAQVLHEACGIKHWAEETGISTIYPLDTNYRNTPAVVDFCNRNFDQNMKYVGKPNGTDAPRICTDRSILRSAILDKDSVVIVKDREALHTLCMETGLAEEKFEFFDTTATKAETTKIKCYSVYAAKGLEFSRALVFVRGMTNNQKTVACTRAMQHLSYYM